jgi:hypothetical protein
MLYDADAGDIHRRLNRVYLDCEGIEDIYRENCEPVELFSLRSLWDGEEAKTYAEFVAFSSELSDEIIEDTVEDIFN